MTKLEELKKLRKPIRNINVNHKQSLTRLEKFAVLIADRIGTMGFFFIILAWTFLWLLWNTFAPQELRFDPFPAFVLWLFISNMIQLFFLPLIMISQNLEKRRDELRAEHDFEVNLKTEREVEVILSNLEKQEEMISKILERLENKK
ncbi:MAG: DUF1003 domain-containing protein [Patescibacteria group bacterium]